MKFLTDPSHDRRGQLRARIVTDKPNYFTIRSNYEALPWGWRRFTLFRNPSSSYFVSGLFTIAN
jgi:hypothetical protein